jgi:hypothetical protein
MEKNFFTNFKSSQDFGIEKANCSLKPLSSQPETYIGG